MKKRIMYALLLCELMLCGCAESSANSFTTHSFFAMDTYMTVTADCSELSAVADVVESVEARLSVTRSDSEVYRLNQSGSADLSAETAELLRLALELHDTTGGALDITMYPISREWGFTTREYTVPDSGRLTELMSLCGAERIESQGSRVTLPQGMMLDFGALGKGYAADLAAEKLREMGIKSALLDFGGNILTIGANADGSPWRIGVADPRGGGLVGTLLLTDKCAVTSGGYERYFTDENGVRYHHILDPKTGCPAESGLASVTVVGESGALCDGLSTALFVMGKQAALDYRRQHGGIELVLISESGEITVTEGLAELFSPTDGRSFSVV